MTAVESDSSEASVDFEPWKKPAGLTRRGWLIVGGIVLLMNVPVLHNFLKGAPEANVSLPYQDDFSSRDTLARNYFTSGGLWRVVNGQLFSPGVHNNPFWLKAKLPRDVSIDFDVHSDSPEGDIRVEVFGNGVDHLSGYELIHGGWNNSRSAIVKFEETAPTLAALQQRAREVASNMHLASAGIAETGVYGRDTSVVVEGRNVPVVPRRTYHWHIERRGNTLRWDIDGQPYLQFDDPFPLEGKGHDRFGPSSADADVYYDNLRVEPLDAARAAQPFPTAPAAAAPVAEPPAASVPSGPFADTFNRTELGPDWLATDPAAVTVKDGSLLIQNAHNHPVWLKRPIPENALIEFETWTDSPVGDMKVEVWGDGQSFHTGALNAAYVSTGYVFVFGGWNNTLSALAKQHEHGPDRLTREDIKVVPGQHYKWQIARKGGRIGWLLDGKPFLAINDPAPLTGAGHQYFAIADWESPVHFANLKVQALPE